MYECGAGLKGRAPKAPEVRRRRNKASTAAELVAEAPGGPKWPPGLPSGRKWRSETRVWWDAVWSSPMAAAGQYLEADLDGLLVLAVLKDKFWTEPSAGLAAEIRHYQEAYGLTPIARRRLDWKMKQGEKPAETPDAEKPKRRRGVAKDPRKVLYLEQHRKAAAKG